PQAEAGDPVAAFGGSRIYSGSDTEKLSGDGDRLAGLGVPDQPRYVQDQPHPPIAEQCRGGHPRQSTQQMPEGLDHGLHLPEEMVGDETDVRGTAANDDDVLARTAR